MIQCTVQTTTCGVSGHLKLRPMRIIINSPHFSLYYCYVFKIRHKYIFSKKKKINILHIYKMMIIANVVACRYV